MASSRSRGIFSLRSVVDNNVGRCVRKNLLDDAFYDVCTLDLNKNELCRAVGLGSLKLIRTLVEGGFDVNSPNDDGQTALMVVAIKAPSSHDVTALDIMRYLLQHGAQVNLQDRFGKTALMYAIALQQKLDLVSCLLRAKSNMFLEDNIGFTALTYTYNTGNEHLIKLMSEYCNEQGREMVILETRLSANFMSYLKIQKLVGASRSTVALSKDTPKSARSSRRLSGQFGEKLASLLNVGSSSRRRASSIGLETLQDSRRRSQSVGQVNVVELRNKRPPSPAIPKQHSVDRVQVVLEEGRCHSCGRSSAMNETETAEKDVQCNLISISQSTSMPQITFEQYS